MERGARKGGEETCQPSVSFQSLPLAEPHKKSGEQGACGAMMGSTEDPGEEMDGEALQKAAHEPASRASLSPTV